MGILNQMDNPELNKVIDEIALKVKKANLILGTAAGNFPQWKARGVDWFCGTSDWGAMAAGIRAFKKECESVN
jgi:hypothetical protein